MAPTHPDGDGPPENLRPLFKRWQAATIQEINESPDIVDVCRDEHRNLLLEEGRDTLGFDGLPGLLIFPNLLSDEVQLGLLDRIVHRDLSNPLHQTNLHFHHQMPYDKLASARASSLGASFFDLDKATILSPKDPVMHKSLTVEQMLQRKLRWMTLGGQYDWTRKVYPDEVPPVFPADIAHMLKSFFPDVDPQAAIVNFYTPGDTLSVHRDTSEASNRALISISIGCDAIFLVANQEASQIVVMRLRSGDAVLMSGESRFAWHGVPKVLEGTCPEKLKSWPATPGSEQFRQWHGWLGSKRINLNVRQMNDQPS